MIQVARAQPTGGGEAGDEAGASGASPADDLRFVAFYGAGDEVRGARITGVRPGSAWAQKGLREGDVLRAADDEACGSADRLRERLASGWRPRAWTVERPRGDAGTELVTLPGA